MASGDDARRNFGQVVTLVVVAVIVLAAVVLLQRTLSTARAINDKAANIAETGRGINTATDSIIQLNDTDQLGKNILRTAEPLVGQLDTVIGLATNIDNKATSITNSALAINSSALAINADGDEINSTAHGIESELGQILNLAESIRGGVAQININVDTTIDLARAIKADTATIVGQAQEAGQNLACADAAIPLDANTGGC